MKKQVLALALALFLPLSACGETEGPAPVTPTPTPSHSTVPAPTAMERTEFTLPYYPDGGLHPITGVNRTNLALAPLVYQGLFELDQSFRPHGVLCGSHAVSEDGLTWTFTLADARFSDGSALTSADVAASLNLAMGEESPYAARFGNVKSVRAAGEGEVTVTLASPNANLPALLDVPIVRESGADTGPLGTGDYYLAEEGDGLVLLRKAGSAAPMEHIGLYAVQGADGLIHAFDTREISLVSADLTGTNALGFSGSYEVWDYPTSVLLYVGYNAQKGACRDAAVRQALSRSFDRSAVAKSLLSGHAAAANLPFPSGSELYDQSRAAGLDYAPQAVDELLTAAGWILGDGVRYKGGLKLSLTFIVNTDNTYKTAVAEFLVQNLTQAGVGVELKKLTWEEYGAALEAGDFDLYLGQVKLTGDLDLTSLVGSDGTLNYGGCADPETDELLAAFLAAGDTARPAAASDLCRRLGENAPITPICFKNWSALTHWGQLSGLKPTQQNVFYDFRSWKTP